MAPPELAAERPSLAASWRAKMASFGRLELYALIWLPTALSDLWTKYLMLPRQRDRIAFSERVSFFREDLLLVCFVLPLVLPWLLRRWIKSGLVLALSALASLLCLLLLFVQLKSYRTVGQLLNYRSLVAAVQWGLHDAKSAEAFAPAAGLLKLGVMMAAVILAAVVAYLARAHLARSLLVDTKPGRVLLAGVVVAVILPWLPRVSGGFYQRSALLSSIAALASPGDAGDEGQGAITTGELRKRYEALSRTPTAPAPSPYDGTAEGSNVLLFIFETGPAAALPIDGDLTEFPNIKRLCARGFVSPRHYSTAPYTSRAIYSLFSGIYPWNLTDSEIHRDPDMKIAGFPRLLADRGYDTASFHPHLPWTDPDDELLHDVGFRRNFFADSVTREKQEHTVDRAMSLDRQALDELKRNLVSWAGSNQKWAAAFLPQLGHGPWHDISPDHHVTQALARGRALMAVQDKWLGEVLDLLEREHVLDRTLVVVTADHGVRNVKEAPDFQVGMAEGLSFQVPFVLYAPRTLTASAPIDWPTSHIDIGPTLLALLNVPNPASGGSQGWPLWDRRLAERRTFFVGQFYFGADAFFDHGRFFMRGSLSEKVFASREFHFSDRDEISRESSEYAEVTERLHDLNSLQRRWVAGFALPAASASPANH